MKRRWGCVEKEWGGEVTKGDWAMKLKRNKRKFIWAYCYLKVVGNYIFGIISLIIYQVD